MIDDRRERGQKLAFVWYMECGPSLDKVDDARRCLCLQWATAGSAETRQYIENKGEDRDALTAGKWFGTILLQCNASKVHVSGQVLHYIVYN